MHPLLHSVILEDIFNDLVRKFPALEPQLSKARANGVKPKYFGWLAKILSSSQEPIEDIIPLLLTFDKKQPALVSKFGGKVGDIHNYKSTQELSDKLEELGKQSTQDSGMSGNYEILYQDNQWIVALPRSTQESCELGSGTTWCTARTQSQNLFLNYTARGENVFLFYVIQKGVNPRSNPNAKISVGFLNGEAQFDTKSGGITVNAANDGISKADFVKIVGEGNASKFLALMKQAITKHNGKHPAKLELEKIVQDPKSFQLKLKSFKGEEERTDFAKLAAQQSNSSPDVLALLSKDEEPEVRAHVAQNPSTPLELLMALSKDEDKKIRTSVAQNPSTPLELLMVLSQDENGYVRVQLAASPNAPPEILMALSQDEEYIVREYVAENPNTPPEILMALSKDKNPDVRGYVARNPNTPPEALVALSNEKEGSVRGNVAKNPNTPPEILMVLSKDQEAYVRGYVAKNPKTRPEILMALSKDEKRFIRDFAFENPNFPSKQLAEGTISRFKAYALSLLGSS